MQEKIIPLLRKAHKELSQDDTITDLLTEELQKTGASDQALALAWEEFTKEYMSDEALNRLQAVSNKMKCWKEYYQKGLAFLEEQDQKTTKRGSGYSYYGNVRERRVEVLFSHSDQQAAWELAQGSTLSEDCWLKLATWRAKDYPQKAAVVIRKLLEVALRPTGEYAYQHVVELLQIYRKYLQMAGNEAEFTAYCASIRQEYKRRRLLMERMTAAKM